ncbi:MAG TPA: GNAT family N-acetyltransferase [Blastocatellia bacterium]|nr:GNAT family N-acetyltransferase [Blastocatellia bacterium]
MTEPAAAYQRRLTVEVLADDAAFDRIEGEWDELLESSRQRVYFLRWDWNRTWWRSYRPADSRLFLVSCRDVEGRLVGLAPLYLVQRRTAGIPHVREALFLGTGIYTNTSEYLDIIARRGFERQVVEAIVAFLRENREWDRLWLYDVPSASTTLAHLLSALGPEARSKVCNGSSYVDTTGDWNTVKNSLGKTLRSNIDRHIRRLFRHHCCEFRRVERADELEAAVERFVILHQARWESKGEAGSFALPRFKEFLVDAMRESLDKGNLRLWTLEVDGEIEAVLLAFCDDGVAHYFQGGFNPAYSKESLGTVMIGLCLKDCAEANDVREFDFMGGEADYKSHWTKATRETIELEWMRQGMRSLLYTARVQAESFGRSIGRATVPAPVRAAGRRIIDRRQLSNKRYALPAAAEANGATASDFFIRQATGSDLDRVKRLIAKMSSGDVEARYKWLYESNPHGRALTWVAIDKETGETAGCTSVFPRRVMVERWRRAGSIGGDCFVEPRFRRKGLATALHRASFAAMREEGIDFMYGPPVVNNLAALLKAGSHAVTGYRRWVRPLTGSGAYRAAFSREPSKLEARLADLPVLLFDQLTRADAREFLLERVTEFGSEFDELFDRVAAKHKIACVRDSRYLAWRYLASPNQRQIPFAIKRGGELMGLLVLEVNGEKSAVVDLFTKPDPKLIDASLQLAMGYGMAAGCSSLELSLTEGSALSERLRASGFIRRDERGFQVAVSTADPQFELLTGEKSWLFMEADQDLDTVFVE